MTTMEADLTGLMTEAKTLDVELNSLSSNEDSNIVGMMVLDTQGLVVGVQGELVPGLDGVAQNIVCQASKLQEDGENPVIVINTDTRKYLIKKEDKITTAIVKKL